ncbi:MAG: efflux RND transporter periplasmic adaptor subunit [Phycisphaerales bacterium]
MRIRPPILWMCAPLLLAACSKPADNAAAAPKPAAAVPVAAARAEIGSSPIDVRAVGSVEPIAAVTLRPQIAGQIVDLPAGEGVDVKAGDVLALLDSRPHEAALRLAEAELARDRAIAEDARMAASQYADAMVAKAMAKRAADEAEAKAKAAEASVMADEAAVQTAKLNLEYCRIVAPFSGRLGSLMVKRGAVVKANETDIVELVQTAPINVTFSIPEDRLAAVQAGLAAGKLAVQADIPGDSRRPVVGNITFVDSKVDSGTGTIRLKATFVNEDKRLWAGQFINTILNLGHENQVVLVPNEAVTMTQDGPSVYVIKPDRTVEVRLVTAGRSANGKTMITRGIEAGDEVVTDGQLRLAPGIKVEVKQAAKAKDASKDNAKGSKTPGKGATAPTE